MQLDDHFALSTLPYFEVKDGRILLASDVGPIADVHTHLALAFGPTGNVDLWKRHDEVLHYLPVTRPLDLDVYMNRNFTPEDLRKMKVDLVAKGVTPWGMRKTHTAANLEAEMADLGIAASVLLPIDLAAVGRNAESYLGVSQKTTKLISLGSVHPNAKDRRGKLEAQKAAGARGIKVHPAVQGIAPDDPKAMELYGMCGELDLPVLWHCGPVDIETKKGRRLCQLENYAEPVARFPETTFVLGHSGALQMPQALALALAHDNVWLETASQSLSGVRTLVRDAPPGRLMLGSDWPFYHQATALSKALLATEGNEGARRRILWDNAQRLFALEA